MKKIYAIGLFDGVHLGHRRVLETAAEMAAEFGAAPAALTFAGLPKPGGAVSDGEAKKLLIAGCGIGEVRTLDFKTVKDMTPEEFVKGVLTGELGAVGAVVGEDFRFGRGRGGTVETLASLLPTRVAETVYKNGVRVSSTFVRELLKAGRMAEAEALCGHPFTLTGEVERGLAEGAKTLKTATVNLPYPEELLRLPPWVYASAVSFPGLGRRRLPAVTNAGTCPTFGEREYHTETHILGFEGDVYGESAVLEVFDMLREEREFSSPEELRGQIRRDIEAAKAALEKKLSTGGADEKTAGHIGL